MTLSVLMSIYGARDNPDHLRQAFDSLCPQTRPAEEVVVVLDGPATEAIHDVIETFKPHLPLLILPLPINIGLGGALALGMEKCKGECIARMDSDDICHADRFAAQLQFLQSNPTTDVVGSAIAEFKHDPLQVQAVRLLPASNQALRTFIKFRNPLNHMTVMFRASAVHSAGGYKAIPGFEDYHLWARMVVQGLELRNLPEALVYARVGNGMQQRRGGLRYLRAEIDLQRYFRDIHLLSRWEYVRNVLARFPIRLLPNSFRGLVYGAFLRKRPSLKSA